MQRFGNYKWRPCFSTDKSPSIYESVTLQWSLVLLIWIPLVDANQAKWTRWKNGRMRMGVYTGMTHVHWALRKDEIQQHIPLYVASPVETPSTSYLLCHRERPQQTYHYRSCAQQAPNGLGEQIVTPSQTDAPSHRSYMQLFNEELQTAKNKQRRCPNLNLLKKRTFDHPSPHLDFSRSIPNRFLYSLGLVPGTRLTNSNRQQEVSYREGWALSSEKLSSKESFTTCLEELPRICLSPIQTNWNLNILKCHATWGISPSYRPQSTVIVTCKHKFHLVENLTNTWGVGFLMRLSDVT